METMCFEIRAPKNLPEDIYDRYIDKLIHCLVKFDADEKTLIFKETVDNETVLWASADCRGEETFPDQNDKDFKTNLAAYCDRRREKRQCLNNLVKQKRQRSNLNS